MATKKNTATQEKATRTYGPRKARFVLMLIVEGRPFVSVESWTDRAYAEYLASRTEGTRVMQRGGKAE